MSRLWSHVRRLWPGPSIHLPLLLVYWSALMGALGLLRSDHVLTALAVAGLAFFSEKTKRLLVAFSGFVFVALIYDASRFVRDLGVSQQRTLLCNLREVELSLFGITAGGQRQTLQDYFLAHHTLPADVFFAVPYGLFLLIAVGYAIDLYRKDARACAQYVAAFAILNALGIVTYHLLPAAPPWYFHKFGCTVDLQAAAFEGQALARVDALVGFQYFRDLYGRASEVFGAIPSLHVAYPLLIVLMGWRRHGNLGRALSVFYWLWMCVAAVYLDHHWVTDLLVGWVYAAAVVWAVRGLPARWAIGGTFRSPREGAEVSLAPRSGLPALEPLIAPPSEEKARQP